MRWEEIEKLITEAKNPLDVMESMAHMQRAYYNALVADGFDDMQALGLVVSTTASIMDSVAVVVANMVNSNQ